MPTDKQKSIFLQELETGSSGDKQNKPKKKKSAIALFVAIFMLFLLIIALFIFVMSVGGSGNPVLKAFGVPEDDTKNFLLGLVNWVFGGFSLLLLIVFTIALFLGLATKKEQKLKRRGSFILSLTSAAMIFVVILVWLGMWNFVNAFVVESSSGANILMYTEGDPEDLKAPIDIKFSAEDVRKSIERKGYTVEGFKWDFGTGVFQPMRTEDSVIQHFSTSGEFLIQLEVVTEEQNDFSPYKLTLEIEGAEFMADPSVGDAPLRVNFDASSVTKSISTGTYDWDFDGDGEFDETTKTPKAVFTYEKIGVYDVKLRAVNNSGNVKLFEKKITVTGESAGRIGAVINFISENSGTAPFKVVLTGTDSFSVDGRIINYQWQFNDGSVAIHGETITHIFEEPGTYNIELTVKDEMGNIHQTEKAVTVKAPISVPEAVITTTPKANTKGIVQGQLPLTVKFDASKSLDKDNNIIDYNWDFDGDDKVDDNGSVVEYIFREEGEYDVKLTLIDADDNVVEKIIKIIAEKQKLQAEIMANPSTGTAPLTVEFDGSESWCDEDSCNIVSFEWDFGDGSNPELTGAQVQHYYPNVGIYDVSLTIYTNTDRSAKTTKKVYVREIPLTACFLASRTEGTSPLTVSFDPSCTIGSTDVWEWDFGDGIKQKTRKPTHTFKEPGVYTVQLKVFDDKNNVSTETLTIEVSASQE